MITIKMLRRIFIGVLLVYGCYSADHNTFKDCSRVSFCSNLRSRNPQDKYVVDVSSINTSDMPGHATLTLVSTDNSSNLTLALCTLQNNTLRIQIKEVDSVRYELKDVLVSEPVMIAFDNVSVGDKNLLLQTGDNKMIVNYSPFSIEAYKNNNLELVFNGDRLTFESSLDQAFAFGVSFPKAKQIYGIHEHADNLALQTTEVGGTDPYRLRNLDVAGYELYSPMSLYGAIPVLYGHGPEATSGIFIHNAAEQWFEIANKENNSEAYVMVESGALDLFVFLGPNPTEVVRQYVVLTGTAHLPQFWALGYHQCRWNYMSQEDLKDVVANFNTYNFPLDVIWLDIEYTDSKKYFTWNANNFSDPVEMQQNISATNKRLVTIIDPHIKVEQGYNVYDGALQNDLFVKNANGSNFQGDCWPGLSSYMDFLNPEARNYYSSYYSYENFPSSTPVLAGIWNDMNEPSVFDDSLEKTLPGDAVHYGGVVHRDIHNIYGLLHTMSTHQGLMDRDNGTKRPFVLTRSHFAGSQRYAAIWTGDNTADWGFLSISYAECLNANLLGIVFCGADVGGFFNDPDVELLQRWYQAGAWLPFYRAHANMGTQRREPYLFPDDVQQVIRNAIQLRYSHLPAWYTLFYEHTRNGDPIIRPLFYHYPSDVNTFNMTDHLLVGRDILVRAVTEPGALTVPVYFPGGPQEQWISINDNFIYEGNGFVNINVTIEAIPIYYRLGSVIIIKDQQRLSTDEMLNDTYLFVINLGENNTASGTLYIDDNTSFNYINNDEYNYIQIDYDQENVRLTKIDKNANSDNFEFLIESIVLNEVVVKPQNGKPGSYRKTVYKRDVNNNLLLDLKPKFDKPFTIKLL